MQLRNPFSQETRKIFFYNYECWWCFMNGWDALHHIVGRKSNSPLNAAPIHNQSCHIGNAALDSFESQGRLLRKTFNYLVSEGYKFTKEDKQFMKDNKAHYEL